MEFDLRGFSAFGFAFDPFKQLDSTKDAHLQEYLVIPGTAEGVLSDQPVSVFAKPGGGKSALRTYAFNFYKDSRGVRFPLIYIPQTYSNEPDLHFLNLQRSLASAVFMYWSSYPDFFFGLSQTHKRKIKSLLLDIPFGLEFALQILSDARLMSEVEYGLGAPAMSGIRFVGQAHRELASELRAVSAFSSPLPLEDSFEILYEVIRAKSIHIMIDGLDGFIETRTSQGVIDWIVPLLKIVDLWQKRNIYLKFFLPMDVPEAISLPQDFRVVELNWDDNLLGQVIRRRVFVASGGQFDSLDAISAPEIRNVELILARQLAQNQKLPRQMILKCGRLLQSVVDSRQQEITSEHLNMAEEASHV